MLLSLLSNITDIDAGEITQQASKVIAMISNLLTNGNTTTNPLATFLNGLNTSYSILLSAICLILGLAGCFFGYKLCKLFTALTGFFAGLVIGALIGSKYFQGSNGIIILCALAGGIILASLAYRIYLAGIFVLCFFLGFVTAANLIPLTGNIQFFLCTVSGFIIATLALKFVRPVIILTSAVTCANMAVKPLLALAPMTGISFFQESYARLVCFLVLFLLGSIVQFATTTDPTKKKSEKKDRGRRN